MKKMNDRLRDARMSAGFMTATQAIDRFGWKGSTYRAHENGQNGFGVEDAQAYAKAYGVTTSWLLIGNSDVSQEIHSHKGKVSPPHRHDCIEHIYKNALLLLKDPSNMQLLNKLNECIISHKNKLNEK